MAIDYLGWGGLAYRVGLIVNTHTGYSGGGPALFDTTDFEGKSCDGNFSAFIDGSWAFGNETVTSAKSLVWDFRAPLIVKKMKWWQSLPLGVDNLHQFQGSNNGSSWTDIGAPIEIDVPSGQNVVFDFTADNSTAYRFYRLLGVSGDVTSGPWQQETEFETDHGPYETGDRTADLTITVNGLTLAGGTANNLVDGLLANDDDKTIRFDASQSVSGSVNIEVDFGETINLRAAALMSLALTGGGVNNGVWQPQIWNGASWQNFGSSFTMVIGPKTSVFTDTAVDCSKFRLLGVSGTTDSTVRLNEFFFMTEAVVPPPVFEASFVDEATFDASPAVGTGSATFIDEGELDATITIIIAPVNPEVSFTDESQLIVREASEPVPTVNSIIIQSGR